MQDHRLSLESEDSVLKNSIIIRNKFSIHKLITVLRLDLSQKFKLSFIDGKGLTYETKVSKIAPQEIIFEITNSKNSTQETLAEINFGVPIIKVQAFEWMIQKLSELGVKSITGIAFERSQSDFHKALNSKIKRLQTISSEATKQSQGALFTTISIKPKLEDFFFDINPQSTKIFANERLAGKTNQNLAQNLQKNKKFSLIVGPEGGLTDREVCLLEKEGFLALGLGPRLLKAETAAIVLASKFLFP